MSKQNLRYAILVFGMITGVIHAIILNLQVVNWLMLLNGLGFFVLTLVVFMNPGFLAGQRRLVHYLFMAYILVTIVGYFVLNPGDPMGPLAIIAKADEVLLLIVLWLHLNK